ncbi:MAG: HD domain-containing phosphohydrolase [Nitriliruptoraceae bacterium]
MPTVSDRRSPLRRTDRCSNVGRMAAELARSSGMPPANISRMQLAGHLHDVGRASLPSGLVESDALTDEERALLQGYPARSAQMLQLMGGHFVADVVRHHRERWDETGFPDGRERESIHEGARILAVAHAVDEIVSQIGAAQALIMARLRSRAGTDLDPAIVATATTHLPAILSARN